MLLALTSVEEQAKTSQRRVEAQRCIHEAEQRCSNLLGTEQPVRFSSR